MQQRKILFLTLTSFSSTGGIEKFNRALLKALVDLEAIMHIKVTGAGMYDASVDKRYINADAFQQFQGKKISFIINNCIRFFKTDHLIIGHINLSILGILFKLLQPHKQLTVICHGIEVFDSISFIQKMALHLANKVLAVSNYTRDQLITKHQLNAAKVFVFPNTIDPFFEIPVQFEKPAYLLKRYELAVDTKVIFTLTRLNSNEGYKGYDLVLNALPDLISKGYSCKYILAGKADAAELERARQMINKLKLHDYVIMPGFIADDEVADHYRMADVFVMPSKGEGFGIVYIEAMAFGLPVIAGNKDGSTEALQFGKLGTLIDPDNKEELIIALENAFHKERQSQHVQQHMLQYFSFTQFKKRLQLILENNLVSGS
mgnify:CR=1 FL=1